MILGLVIGLLAPSVASAHEPMFGARFGYYASSEHPFLGAEVLIPVSRAIEFNPNVEYVFADGLTAPGGDLRVWSSARHVERALPALRELLELPFEHVIVWDAPQNSQSAASSSPTSGPMMNWPCESTRWIARSM